MLSKFSLFFLFVLGMLFITNPVLAAYPFGDEVVRYQFEGAATATSTNNGTGGTTYDGTFFGAASTTAVQKRFGSKGAVFGETADYMKTYYGNGINPTTQSISVSLWAYKGNNNCTSDDDHIFGVSGSPTNNRFYIRCKNSTTNKWGYRIQGNAEVFSTASVSTTTWDHIVLVANAATDQASYYVNGVAIGAPVAYTTFTLPGNFYVGNYNDTVGSDLTQGGGVYIDEVAIYDRALTALEVTDMYQSGQPGGQVSSFSATGYEQKAYLAWTAGSGTTTDYLVEYKLSSEPTTWTTFSHSVSTSTNIQVTGLTNGSAYDFRITPKNGEVLGTVSATVSATPISRISFISPTPTQSSTISTSSFTVYASSSLPTASFASSTHIIRLETSGGAFVAEVSTSTRYGDYNLTHLTNTLSGSDLSLTANSSGIAYVPTTDTLFVVHNIGTGLDTTIDEVNKNGAVVRTITCTACGDIEGITLVSSIASTTIGGYDHTLMISSENDTANAEIYRMEIHSTGVVTVNTSNYYDTGITHSANGGLEGIAYNPVSGVYYVARELSTPALYEVVLGAGHSATATQICTGLTWNAGITDFSDLAYNNGVLYVLSENTNPSKLVAVNITSTSSCSYVDNDGDSDVSSSDTGDWLSSIPVGGTDQAEGVTWDSTGDTLWVLGEADFLAKYRTNAFTTRHTFTGLADGDYVIKSAFIDINGVVSSSTDRAFTIDAEVSAPSVVSTPVVVAVVPPIIGPQGGSSSGVSNYSSAAQQSNTPAAAFKALRQQGVVIKAIQAPGKKKNNDIKNIQKILNADKTTQIAKKGPGSPGKETDLYGDATKAAVGKFQIKYKILKASKDKGYGVVGPKTLKKMNDLLKNL